MQERSSNSRLDVNQFTKFIIDEPAIEEMLEKASLRGKNPAAVFLGRLGGLKGGKARAKKLSSKRRSQIAKKAARARWNKQ